MSHAKGMRMTRERPKWGPRPLALVCALLTTGFLATGLSANGSPAPPAQVTPSDGQSMAAMPTGTLASPLVTDMTDSEQPGLTVEGEGVAGPSAGLSPPTLQAEILNVVDDLAASKQGLGYDLSSFYTEPLMYGASTLAGKGSPKTMCVGAVTEIMIRAINRWSEQNPDIDVYGQLPASKWQGGSLQSLRPWLFVWKLEKEIPSYKRAYGAGTHDALILFGMGQGVKFSDAAPGDFVNFSRNNGSGHAAVFLSYLKADFEETETFGPDVMGFKYFSAQGSGEAGLDYRYAYFDGYCPARRPAPTRRDCGVLKSDNAATFSMARLYAPSHWRTGDTRYFLEEVFEKGRSFEEINAERYAGEPKALGNRTIQQIIPYITQLVSEPAVNFSGETTD